MQPLGFPAPSRPTIRPAFAGTVPPVPSPDYAGEDPPGRRKQTDVVLTLLVVGGFALWSGLKILQGIRDHRLFAPVPVREPADTRPDPRIPDFPGKPLLQDLRFVAEAPLEAGQGKSISCILRYGDAFGAEEPVRLMLEVDPGGQVQKIIYNLHAFKSYKPGQVGYEAHERAWSAFKSTMADVAAQNGYIVVDSTALPYQFARFELVRRQPEAASTP